MQIDARMEHRNAERALFRLRPRLAPWQKGFINPYKSEEVANQKLGDASELRDAPLPLAFRQAPPRTLPPVIPEYLIRYLEGPNPPQPAARPDEDYPTLIQRRAPITFRLPQDHVKSDPLGNTEPDSSVKMKSDDEELVVELDSEKDSDEDIDAIIEEAAMVGDGSGYEDYNEPTAGPSNTGPTDGSTDDDDYGFQKAVEDAWNYIEREMEDLRTKEAGDTMLSLAAEEPTQTSQTNELTTAPSPLPVNPSPMNILPDIDPQDVIADAESLTVPTPTALESHSTEVVSNEHDQSSSVTSPLRRPLYVETFHPYRHPNTRINDVYFSQPLLREAQRRNSSINLILPDYEMQGPARFEQTYQSLRIEGTNLPQSTTVSWWLRESHIVLQYTVPVTDLANPVQPRANGEQRFHFRNPPDNNNNGTNN